MAGARAISDLRSSLAPWVLVAGGFHGNGGMDRLNSALAQYLIERGNKVHLVCHHAGDEFLDQEGVTVHQVPKLAGSFMLGGLLLARHGRSVASRVSAQSPGTRVLVNGGNCVWPDINWVHCVHHAWRLRELSSPSRLNLKHRLSRWFGCRDEGAALQAARVVIANSERTRQDLVNHLGVGLERIHVVYPGVDPGFCPPSSSRRAAARAWLGKDHHKPLVAFVGALGRDANKGIDVLISAWRHLCARPDWDGDLIVAGHGPAAEFWRRQVADAGLDDRISVLGFTNRVPDVLAAADLLVSPVRYESYGLNVAEAICCGIPAMVTESAGVAERYPAELQELLIHHPEDVDGLTAQLLRWRRAVPQWKERIAPFSQQLRWHTLEVMARQVLAVSEPDLRGELSPSPEDKTSTSGGSGLIKARDGKMVVSH